MRLQRLPQASSAAKGDGAKSSPPKGSSKSRSPKVSGSPTGETSVRGSAAVASAGCRDWFRAGMVRSEMLATGLLRSPHETPARFFNPRRIE